MTGSAKQLPESKRKAPSHKLPDRALIGKRGESAACAFLRRKGYQIHGQNVLLPPGEIDIIAFDTQYSEFVFVEVKTRNNTHTHPSEAVDGQKLAVLIRTAQRYMAKHHLAVDYRFDMITVWNNHLEHFENITF
ncbi:YraN family protein [Candidatus Woesebacteria bacterium]|nr:YraN family protein [Candidatus Woesebacteria bacterium]